ncbi:hypothetical protein BH09VER1_BH09VER1_45190 [soil metagenome]
MPWRPEWFWAPVCVAWLAALCVAPVRQAMANGWRCIRRHPVLWKLPVGFVFALGLTELAWAGIFHWRTSTEFPLYLPLSVEMPSLPEAGLGSLLAAAEVLAANINCLLSPFPLSVACALLLLVNFRDLSMELGRTLYRRFKVWGILLMALLFLCLLAELAKPLCLLAGPSIIKAVDFRHFMMGYTVINAMAFAFEYLLGTCLQLYLLLLSYGWVRGLHLEGERLLPFAVRRLGSVTKWSMVIISATIAVVHLPLLLESWLAPEPGSWNLTIFIDFVGRPLLALGMLALSTVQIRLALHNDTLRGAIGGHLEFLRRSGLPCFLFLLAAFVSFLTLKTIESIGESYLGECIFGEAWKILLQTIIAALGGWMLAAWVCFYTSLQRGSRNLTF